MMKKITSLVFIFFITITSSAQKKEGVEIQHLTPSFQKYWSYGGNLGLSFWNNGTDILVAPKAYYHVSQKFITGLGVTYIYSSNKDKDFSYHSNSFGGSVSGIYRPISYLQFSVEYEGLQTKWQGYFNDSYWNNAMYLGAAFVNGHVSLGFRYDVLYDPNKSVYGSAFNPVIGFYF